MFKFTNLLSYWYSIDQSINLSQGTWAIWKNNKYRKTDNKSIEKAKKIEKAFSENKDDE